MKFYKLLPFLLISVVLAGLFSSCKQDDLPNNGEPRIRYVRITNPASGDSLLVGAGQGNLIAIVGENLGDTREIWFNDQPSVLTTTYITSTSILVSVPSKIPVAITNKVKLVFGNGKILEYNFKVEISEPVINSMDCEYVNEGKDAVINGDFFYEPLTVTFTGGIAGKVVSVKDKVITVTVPKGALPGPVTIKTNFGETKSNLWFRDNRNIFISSDPFTGWWNSSFVVSNPTQDDPPAINGNYIRVKKVIGAWNWLEVAGGPPDAMGPISKNVPDEAILKPADYFLKFEVNTMKPYNNNMIKINVGLGNDFNNDAYLWKPPFDTKGQWQTVVIPFNEITESYKTTLTINPAGYYTRILFHGGGDLDTDMSFDNFRVVPKVTKK